MFKKYLYTFFLLILLLFSERLFSQNQKLIDSCNYYIYNGYHIHAIKLLTKLEKESKDRKELYKIYTLLGKAFYDLGERDKSANFYSEGLSLATKNKDSTAIGDFNLLLAGVNIHGLIDLSLQEIREAKTIFQNLHSDAKMNLVWHKFGVWQAFCGTHDSMVYYFNKVIKYCAEHDNDSLLVSVYLNYGVSYGNHNNLKLYYLNTMKAIGLAKKYKDYKALSLCYANISGYFVETNRLDSTLYYANQGIEVASKINYVRPKIVAYQTLIEAFKKRNDYKSAFTYSDKYHRLYDSFRDVNKDIGSLKSQLDMAYKDKESKIKFENLLKEKAADEKFYKQRQLTFLVIGGLLVLLIASLILYNRFKVITRQKNIIEKQKKESDNQKHIIEEKQKEILDSIRYASRIQKALVTSEKYFEKQINKLSGNN